MRFGYLDIWTDSIDKAIDMADRYAKRGEGYSIGLLGNAADIYPEMLRQGVRISVVTDQTPAHDLLSYIPSGLTLEEAQELRSRDPERYRRMSLESMKKQVEAMVGFMRKGAVVFEYGNNIRRMAYDAGYREAFSFPGFVQAYIRPMFEEGRGPFRWASLTGDPRDIEILDDEVIEMF